MQLGGAGGPHKIAPSGKELDLCEGPDDLISTADATHLNLVAFSASTQTETHYIMESLRCGTSSTGDPPLAADSENRRLSEPEIVARQASVGRPLSATMKPASKPLNESVERRANVMLPEPPRKGFELFVSYAHADNLGSARAR